MANEEQFERLIRSVEEWNEWRKKNWKIEINLHNATLHSANLSNANLSNAILHSANLSNAILHSANFISTKLNSANLNSANLRNASLHSANLISTNLRNANLRNANLISANLRNANLISANLSSADLSEAQALNTNFEGAILTGACIEDLNINSATNLNNVICEYIYLKSEYQNDKRIYNDRRPHDLNRNFEPGEFSRLFQIVQDSLSLYFPSRIDWQAAAYSFQSITTDGTPLDIQGIDKTDDGGVVIRVKVPESANKGQLEGDFWKGYEAAQKAFEGERRNADRLIASQERQLVRDDGKINQLMAKLDELRTINIAAQEIHGLEVMAEKDSRTTIYGGDHIENSEVVATRPTLSDNAQVAHTINESQQQDLASAAKEIQDLLAQLEKSNPTATTLEQMTVATEAIRQIEGDPTLKQRLISATKGGALEAIKQTPVGKIVAGAIDGWSNPS